MEIEVSDKSDWFGANTYDAYLDKVYFYLSSLGFKKLTVCKTYTTEEVNFLTPTILCTPYIEEKTRTQGVLVSSTITSLYKEFGTASYLAKSSFVTQELDENPILLCFPNGVRYGVYYPSRKALILHFNIFATYKRINFLSSVFNLIDRELKQKVGDLSIVNLSPEEIAKRRQQEIKDLWKKFSENVTLAKSKYENETENLFLDVKSYQNNINSKLQNISRNKIIVTQLENYISIQPQEFEAKIEQIKLLPFVKNISYNSSVLEIDVGKITLIHKSKKCYIGDFIILLSPTEIKFLNKDCPVLSKGLYAHPHINGNGLNCSPCWGSAATDVYLLLTSLRLKELIFLLYQYLNTYTSGEGGNPYRSFEDFKMFRTQENKFDDDGNLKIEESRNI